MAWDTERLVRALGVAGGLIVSAAAITSFFGFFGTEDVANPPGDPLADGAIGAKPFSSPSAGAAVYLAGDGDLAGTSWLLTAEGSSTEISFRQAAVINLQIRVSESPQPERQGYPVVGSDIACLDIQTSAFTVTGPTTACAALTDDLPKSWAWTLVPKTSTSGPQAVAVSLTIKPPNETSPDTIELPTHHATRFISVDVKRNFLDRYTPFITGLIAAAAVIGAAALGLFRRG